MKKILFVLFAAILVGQASSAQAFKSSKYYNPQTGHLDYSGGGHTVFSDGETYYGFRIGPAFSTISSDDNAVKASDSHTGLNIGAVMGACLSNDTPLFIEGGLYYTEKGGDAKISNENVKYNLDYIMMPITFKYVYEAADNLTLQPLFGVYAALGVGGHIKYYTQKISYDAFDDNFNRFDAGLRMGCGLGYDPFYAELTYDLGLTNISHDTFDTAHTRSLMLTFGVNF